jgi:hypothetical protein
MTHQPEAKPGQAAPTQSPKPDQAPLAPLVPPKTEAGMCPTAGVTADGGSDPCGGGVKGDKGI